MMTKVLIDENLSEYFAEGLETLQKPNSDNIEVTSIVKEFYRGVADEEWIPSWGKRNGVFITQDRRISTRKNQVQLLMDHKLGAFFLNVPKTYRYWDKVKIVINNWPEIVEKIKSAKRPFAFEITPRGGVRKMSL